MAKLNKAGQVAKAAKTAANREANKKKPALAKQKKNAYNEGRAVAKAERSSSQMDKKVTFKAGASGRGAGKVVAAVGESFNYGSDNAKKTKAEDRSYARGKASVPARVKRNAPRGGKISANRKASEAAKSRGSNAV
jgi:hypothetical protein